MHGNYRTPGLARPAAYAGPAHLVLNGVLFTLINENVPVDFYQATINEADFAKLVLSRTNGKPIPTRSPNIKVDGVAWVHASNRGHWVGKLLTGDADLALQDGSATASADGNLAADPWQSAAA